MKGIGFISKTVAHHKYHELTTAGEKKYVLFFEEIVDDRFSAGDVLEFEIGVKHQFGLTALSPIKKGNIYLEDLKKFLLSQELVSCYVYSRRDDGYSVSYKGFRCFLPDVDISNESLEHGRSMILLDRFQDCVVTHIKDGHVRVSIKHARFNKEQKQLASEEIRSLTKGFAFIGHVINVKGFGVFIRYQFSQGLLHVSNILHNYDSAADRLEKKAIEEKLASVFTTDRAVAVYIDDISEDKYSLNWDADNLHNKEICAALEAFGFSVAHKR